MVESLVLIPFKLLGSTLTILIPSLSSSKRNLPICPLETLGDIISSLFFVKSFCRFLCSFFSKYDSCQGLCHSVWSLVLEDISSICYPFCTCSHCFFCHFQNIFVSFCFWTSSYYYWNRSAFDNTSKRIKISGVYCFYNICSHFCPNSGNMSYNFWIMWIFDIFTPWIHHG